MINANLDIENIKNDFIKYMRYMENQIYEDISNSLCFDKNYSYLLGHGKIYNGLCPCTKNKFELKPDNAIHIIVSNNIYSVWFESQKILKHDYNIELLDDFIEYYKLLTENMQIIGCFVRKRKKVFPLFNDIVDNYILQFQLERDDGYYVIKKKMSITSYVHL